MPIANTIRLEAAVTKVWKTKPSEIALRVTSVPGDNLPAGVYETLSADLRVSHFLVREGGERVPLTEKQALRRVVDALGRDPLRKGKATPVDAFLGREARRIAGRIRRAARGVVGTAASSPSIVVHVATGSDTAASSYRERTGEVKGGWAIYETTHVITVDPDVYRTAMSLLPYPKIEDVVVLEARHAGYSRGYEPIFQIQGARTGGGNSTGIVERYAMTTKDVGIVLGKTYQGVQTVAGRMRREAAEAAVRDRARAEREAERKREAEARRIEAEEAALRAANQGPIPDEDLVAIFG